MSKHTPGPWYNCRSLRAIRVLPASPAFERGIFSIAKYPMRTNKSLVTHEEWEANADLIAAAPEMLTFLEDYLKMYSKECWTVRGDDYQIKLENLIKKAKGE